MQASKATRFVCAVFFLALSTVARAQAPQASQAAPATQIASFDDTARLLAGMSVPDQSPLFPLTQDLVAKQHATHFDNAFGNLDKNQLSKVRVWSAANLTSPSPVLFYMFGGPDFLYADAFFPNATTYVLSGLEPVGPIPDLLKMSRWSALQGLRNIEGSLRSVLTVSYFITVDMYRDLNAGPIPGTLPILYVFLARSGKTIHDVSLVHLDEQATLQPGDGIRPWKPVRGVKIVFSAPGGPQKTLYYFSGNLSDSRLNHILQFCRSLGAGDSFVKSASYLLHQQSFSQVRNFLLTNSATLLQDDTGVPIAYFEPPKWRLRGFGRYVMPIFPSYYQPRLQEFYQRTPPTPIDFGVGYRWRPNESNLLVAVRNETVADVTGAVPEAQPQPPQPPQPAPPRPQAQQQYVPRPAPSPPTYSPDRDGPPFPIFPFFLFGPPQ